MAVQFQDPSHARFRREVRQAQPRWRLPNREHALTGFFKDPSFLPGPEIELKYHRSNRRFLPKTTTSASSIRQRASNQAAEP